MWILRKAVFRHLMLLTSFVILWMLFSSLFFLSETSEGTQPGNNSHQLHKTTTTKHTARNIDEYIQKMRHESKKSSDILPILMNHTELVNVYSDVREKRTLLYGSVRPYRAFLTIGIPTVSRRNGTEAYLITTLDSLISNTKEEDRNETIVVVYVADLNKTWNIDTALALYKRYSIYCDSGFIQIIQSPKNIYPNFTDIDVTLNDPFDRVVWRSKQNIDFAFLMLYSQLHSKFYMQLEDDVISAVNFMDDIHYFISLQKKPWACLEYSELGFIGKLFHSSHLQKIGTFLLLAFNDKPCDLLLGQMIELLGQERPIHSNFSLFQHIGKASSLKNKLMPSIDRKFKNIGSDVLMVAKIPKGDNPIATIRTDMIPYLSYNPYDAYLNDSSFFWAKTPLKHSYYRIIYDKPYNISRVIVSTGDEKYRKDILKFGALTVGNSSEPCLHLYEVGKFIDGELDTELQGLTLPVDINCISIDVRKTQKEWLILRTISVMLANVLT